MCHTFNSRKLISFSKQELFEIRNANKSVIKNSLSQSVKENLKNSKIAKTRGPRGGVNNVNKIYTRITNRKYTLQKQKCTSVNYENLITLGIEHLEISNDKTVKNQNQINPNNLTQIKIDKRQDNCSKWLEFAVINARSIRNKAIVICDYVVENNIDILAITETWLRENDDLDSIGNITPDGYKFISCPRKSGIGGGVALLFKSQLNAKKCEVHSFNTFELLEVTCVLSNKPVHIYVVYRPPPNNKNGLKSSDFFDEFTSFASAIAASHHDVLIVGDINLHLDKKENKDACEFITILDSYELEQHVNEPTHTLGHILDVVISKKHSQLVESVSVSDQGISDHFVVKFNILDKKPSPVEKTVSYRDIKSIDLDKFKADIKNLPLLNQTSQSLSDIVTQYDHGLHSVLETHAPVVTKTYTIRPNTKWYNSNLRQSKVIKRRLERKWLKSGNLKDKEAYRKQCKLVHHLLYKARTDFYSQKILETNNDKKAFFKTAKGILNFKTDNSLPSDNADEPLPDRFGNYFMDKIVKIRSIILEQSDQGAITLASEELFPGAKNLDYLSEFEPATQEEVRKIITGSSSASCDLDPIPTPLLKSCLEEILPAVTNIINLSLSNSKVPVEMKKAIVIPLLKKSTLDPEILKNYRPVSNLNFVSKLIEKLVASRLNNHLQKHDLMESMQSAYRKFHSTETALLRVKNDILTAFEQKKLVALVLLDLSAAFDTIDHKTLLNRMATRFGVSGSALAWFSDYLTGRCQVVSINNTTSQPKQLSFGVPQGSVLGPILFTIYTVPVGDIARRHGLGHHFYADDSQLYLAFKPGADLDNQLEVLETCIRDIRQWMAANLLKLNDDKTEVLLLGSPHNLKKLDKIAVCVGSSKVPSSFSVNNLGSVFDCNLDMDKFITKKCQSAIYYLQCISRIKKFLSIDAKRSLIHAFVTSRLDYANSLLYGSSQSSLARLQKIQNYAARIITGTKRSDHITPILKQLHWLPISKRIDFKILIHTFNSINGSAPSYLSDLLEPYSSIRHLRSNNEQLLKEHLCKTNYGSSSFKNAAPVLWNKLPLHLKSSDSISTFKKKLKTHLFDLYYC